MPPVTVSRRAALAAAPRPLRATADMNITPMIVTVIDAAKGAGVDRVGIVTEGMRRQ